MKLSIYGATGFIGRNFNILYPYHTIIKREEREPKSKDILFLISNVENHKLDFNASKHINTNLYILCEVLNYCKKEDIVFNFVSSSLVYGKLDDLPAIESSRCNPKGFYSITKKCAEDLIISFSETFKLKYRIIRLCNVLGRGDGNISKERNTLTWMVNNLKGNKDIELYDKGEQVRDIIHVKDACKAIELICRAGEKNQIYNVSSGKAITIKNFINIAKNKLNSISKIKYIETPKSYSEFQNKYFWMDTKKLRSLGFRENYSHEDIINELCN